MVDVIDLQVPPPQHHPAPLLLGPWGPPCAAPELAHSSAGMVGSYMVPWLEAWHILKQFSVSVNRGPSQVLARTRPGQAARLQVGQVKCLCSFPRGGRGEAPGGRQ